MPPELNRDDAIMRVVDGDTLEIMFAGLSDAKRIPLAWLVVQVHPMRKKGFQIQIGSSSAEQPLYSFVKKPTIPGKSYIVPIRADEEPEFRSFFTELAKLCGRSVTAEDA
ncbi:MAG TPA: hypothetical protein VG014_04860 [Acidimicrobiales bacterium]|jgi:hypothetical protein|nr:hypothetical protein [Acidimicrobiales bacterium]